MQTPEHDPSVEHEPHESHKLREPHEAVKNQGEPSSSGVNMGADSQEQRTSADEDVAGDAAGDAAEDVFGDASGPAPISADLAGQSVFDEPDIFPGRSPEVITQDWSCGECGYNLRGLPTGHRCPECGHIELYRPPPPGAVSYGAWYRQKKAAVGLRRSWGVVALISAVVAVFSLVTAFLTSIPMSMFSVLMGPAIEEAVKVGLIVWLVDSRPYLMRGGVQIRVAAVASAVVFASVQNAVLFLGPGLVYPESLLVILWRWIGCTGLHVGCSLLAISAVVAMWRQADNEARKPRGSESLRPLVIAIVLHMVFNATMNQLGLVDWTF